MEKKRIIEVSIGGFVAAMVVAAGATFAVAASSAQDTHSQISVEQSHLITQSGLDDAALAGSTSRTSAEWTVAQDLAAKKAAEVAAAQAAAVAAAQAQAAADAATAAQQATAASEDDSNYSDNDSGGGSAPSGPSLCPSGTHANAVDANGNESNCEQDGPGGAQCQAYDANNNCTNWYKP